MFVHTDALQVHHFDFRYESNAPSGGPHPTAPIHVAEEHWKPFIPETDAFDNVPAREQAGALRLVNISLGKMIEVAHLPTIKKRRARKQPAQSAHFKKKIAMHWKSTARGLHFAVTMYQLRRDDADGRRCKQMLYKTVKSANGPSSRVGIEKEHYFSIGASQQQIDGAGETDVLGLQNHLAGIRAVV